MNFFVELSSFLTIHVFARMHNRRESQGSKTKTQTSHCCCIFTNDLKTAKAEPKFLKLLEPKHKLNSKTIPYTTYTDMIP